MIAAVQCLQKYGIWNTTYTHTHTHTTSVHNCLFWYHESKCWTTSDFLPSLCITTIASPLWNKMTLIVSRFQIKFNWMLSECWVSIIRLENERSIRQIACWINEIEVNTFFVRLRGKWSTTICDVKAVAGGHFGVSWKLRTVIRWIMFGWLALQKNKHCCEIGMLFSEVIISRKLHRNHAGGENEYSVLYYPRIK